MNDVYLKVAPKHNKLVAIQYTGANETAVCDMFKDHCKPLVTFEIKKALGFSFTLGERRLHAYTAVETKNTDGTVCVSRLGFGDYILLDTENGTFEVYNDLDFARKFMPAE